jgi:hypothetical protein
MREYTLENVDMKDMLLQVKEPFARQNVQDDIQARGRLDFLSARTVPSFEAPVDIAGGALDDHSCRLHSCELVRIAVVAELGPWVAGGALVPGLVGRLASDENSIAYCQRRERHRLSMVSARWLKIQGCRRCSRILEVAAIVAPKSQVPTVELGWRLCALGSKFSSSDCGLAKRAQLEASHFLYLFLLPHSSQLVVFG